MDGLFEPTHLLFIMIVCLIFFGGRKLPKLDKGLGHAMRGALFMAKGVDPGVGRDVGDMLPDEHAGRSSTGLLCLLAILIGNTLYFLSSPLLPAAARIDADSSPGLAALVDLWFCLFVFGVLNLAGLLRRRNTPKD